MRLRLCCCCDAGNEDTRSTFDVRSSRNLPAVITQEPKTGGVSTVEDTLPPPYSAEGYTEQPAQQLPPPVQPQEPAVSRSEDVPNRSQGADTPPPSQSAIPAQSETEKEAPPFENVITALRDRLKDVPKLEVESESSESSESEDEAPVFHTEGPKVEQEVEDEAARLEKFFAAKREFFQNMAKQEREANAAEADDVQRMINAHRMQMKNLFTAQLLDNIEKAQTQQGRGGEAYQTVITGPNIQIRNIIAEHRNQIKDIAAAQMRHNQGRAEIEVIIGGVKVYESRRDYPGPSNVAQGTSEQFKPEQPKPAQPKPAQPKPAQPQPTRTERNWTRDEDPSIESFIAAQRDRLKNVNKSKPEPETRNDAEFAAQIDRLQMLSKLEKERKIKEWENLLPQQPKPTAKQNNGPQRDEVDRAIPVPVLEKTTFQPQAIIHEDPSTYEALDGNEIPDAKRLSAFIISKDEQAATPNRYYFHESRPKRAVRRPMTKQEKLRIASPERYVHFQRECVKVHNEFRKRHGVPELVHSEFLSKVAQEWAEHMAMKAEMYHRPNNEYGENLFESHNLDASARVAVKAWYDEIELYNYNDPKFDLATGHFTQLIWRDTREVGTGVAQIGNDVWVCCNYHPPGNVRGRFNDVYVPRPLNERR